MNIIEYNSIVTESLLQDSLDHTAHTGFLEDYRTITCLLRIYKPQSILEIGTNIGSGINVMSTALPTAKIYSLDLDYATMMNNSKQYPIGEFGQDRVGTEARFPYIQLRGDSTTFDYSKYPVEAYFCDGEHTWNNVYTETILMLKQNPNIIIYHDADMLDVYDGILAAFTHNDSYTLFRVEGTRIAYALKNQ